MIVLFVALGILFGGAAAVATILGGGGILAALLGYAFFGATAVVFFGVVWTMVPVVQRGVPPAS